ncbi:MAG: hypothetical protein N3A01_02150 [Bacteroidales bacterium]|nr:hypothetical protein [Bacteroidales bacterium]
MIPNLNSAFKSLIICSTILYSCKKEIHPSIEQNWLVPLATSEIKISKFLNDTLYNINSDSSISLVYNTTLSKFTIDTFVKLDEINYNYGISLTSLKLNPYNFTYKISMGDIANKDKEENGPSGTIYTTIMTAHNTGQPTTVQSFGPYSYDSIKISTSQYFKYIAIRQAILKISIKNNLPVPLSNISYEVKTCGNNYPLINGNFLIVLPNTQQTNTHFLQNIYIDTLLLAKVTVSSPGSLSPVIIDTSQSAITTITISDLQVDSAIIKIPENEEINYHSNAVFTIPDSAQLLLMSVKQGNLIIRINNTLNTNVNIDFTLPDAIKNNQQLNTQIQIPAGTSLQPSYTEKQVDLSGYDIKFRGIGHYEQQIGTDLNNNGIIDADTCNTLYYHLKISPSFANQYIHIGKHDSISINIQLSSFKVKYIKGFFGYKSITISDTTIQQLFAGVNIDELHAENIIINLISESTIGTKAKCYIQHIKVTNTNKNTYETLTGTVLNTPFIIDKPNDPGYYQQNNIVPSFSYFHISNSNSNISKLFNILPNKFEYSFKLNLNDGEILPQPSYANDFLYDYSYIRLKANIELPLWFSIKNAIIYDTTEFNVKNINIDNISNGKLILHYYNYYPLLVQANIYFLDSTKHKIDSLTAYPILIDSPPVFNTILPISQPCYNKITIDMPTLKLKRILNCKYAAFKLIFNTPNTASSIKLFNSYYLKLNLVGDFSYIFEK